MLSISEIETLLSYRGSCFPLCVFQVFFALSLVMKFGTESVRGYFHYLNPDSFLYLRFRIRHRSIKSPTRLYKLAFILKIIAALCLLFGAGVRPAIFLIAICLFIDLRVYFKFHLALMFLLSVILNFSPSLRYAIGLQDLILHSGNVKLALDEKVDLFPQVFIMSSICILYFCAGMRKLSEVFLSGKLLTAQIKYIIGERYRRLHFDGFYPKFIVENMLDPTEKARLVIVTMMVGVTALELSMPALLLTPNTAWAGCILGVAMHVSFLLLFPATLAHFSLVCIATYILFLPPDIILPLFAF